MAVLQQQSGIRSRPLNAATVAMLTAAANAAGVEVRVFSGGQANMPPGTRRDSSGALVHTGSVRHNENIGAADLTLWKDGRQLNYNNPQDLPIVQAFVGAAVQNGATGIGAGNGYMAPGALHVGFGEGAPGGGPMVWGPGESSKTAPSWLRSAVNFTGPDTPIDHAADPFGVARMQAGDNRPTMYGLQGQTSLYAGQGLDAAAVSASLKANADARGMNYVEVPVSGDDTKSQRAWVESHIQPGDGVVGFSSGANAISAMNLPKGTVAVLVGGRPDITSASLAAKGIVASVDSTHSLAALRQQASLTSRAASVRATPQALDQMTRVVLAEARGEGDQGMAGVASVIKNRALTDGTDISSVLTKANQFAAPLTGGYTAAEYANAQKIAQGVLDGSIPDPTNGATYFANPKTADPAALKQITDAAQPLATIGNHVFYGAPGAVQTASAKPVTSMPVEGALSFDGQTAGLVTGGTPVEPVAAPVPSGPYGADKVVSALQNGDAKGAQKALNDLKVAAASAWNPITNGAAKIKADITNYFQSTLPIVGAAFNKYPDLAKAVPAEMKSGVAAAEKAAPVTETTPLTPVGGWATNDVPADVTINDSGGVDVYGSSKPVETRSIITPTSDNTGAWAQAAANRAVGHPQQAEATLDRAFGTKSDTSLGDGGSFFSSPPPSTQSQSSPPSFMGSGAGAWGSAPKPSTPYSKADVATASPPAVSAAAAAPTLSSALASMGAGQGFGLGTASVPDVATTDPLTAALTVPTVAAHVSFAAPVQPMTAKAPAPKASVIPAAYKPITSGLASGAGFGARSGLSAFSLPSMASTIAAAQRAGFTTGVGAPGYTNSSAYQAAINNGYSPPNFSQGSGGATFAYKPNGSGGGTFLTTDGRTLNY